MKVVSFYTLSATYEPRQNKTKVGLKENYEYVVRIEDVGQNKTKVGLKADKSAPVARYLV